MSDNLVEIKNLCIDFKSDDNVTKRVVKNISFSIPKGKTVALVGESGSGKSVTSLSMLGLIPSPPGNVAEGEILFEGNDILKLSHDELYKIRGNEISMIFQEPMTSLNPVYTVGNQVEEAILLHENVTKEEAKQKVIELFEEVGIPEPEKRVNYYPHEMSGGQKQRVMIAMAIACRPKLLICDEPTTALDVTIQKQVLELMLDLQKQRGMSLLFITHDLAVVADIADEVVVMYRGELVEQGTKDDIFHRPKHPYTKGLLACRPGLEVNPVRLYTVDDFLDENKVIKPLKDLTAEEIKKPNTTDTDCLLDVRNIKKHFPIKKGIFAREVDSFKAVDDVSFKVGRGKILGLVGESGCGKTTLGRTILRLIEPTGGQVIYDGQDITAFNKKELRSFRKSAQIIFQDPYSSLNPRMVISDLLTEPMQIHGVGTAKERKERAAFLLDKVNMPQSCLNRYPHEFSGGQRQRICIARSLMLNPKLVICDESVSALDVSVQSQVLNLLLDLREEFDLSYIFISHDLSVVKFISDDIGVMNKGQIVEYGNADEVYHNPKQEYTKKLLDAIPKGIAVEF